MHKTLNTSKLDDTTWTKPNQLSTLANHTAIQWQIFWSTAYASFTFPALPNNDTIILSTLYIFEIVVKRQLENFPKAHQSCQAHRGSYWICTKLKELKISLSTMNLKNINTQLGSMYREHTLLGSFHWQSLNPIL